MVKRIILFLFILIFWQGQGYAETNKLYPIVQEYVRDFRKEIKKIPEERRYRLNEIVYYLEEQSKNHRPWQLVFIGSDQSVITQWLQVWATTAAYYFGTHGLEVYSAGLKTRKIATKTITTLEDAGFIIYKTNVSKTEVYRVKYSYNLKPEVVFSKKVGHRLLPTSDFMAIVTDKNADMNLEDIRGTYNRLYLSYENPEAYEGTNQEDAQFENTCHQVAVEMFYVFAQLRKRMQVN